ncbi:MAG: cobyric acid synthase CobQ, partial [Thermodesulfovibrionia bacterium]|nr:cobyric acid synthase CobQ [Thermodesulfovibrionia bacterium]
KPLKIIVLGLRYISNFTDFDPFMYEEDVELQYSLDEADIRSADLIIIPGSKNTVSDLILLREHGIEDSVKSAVNKGCMLVGICGGYQMLGQKILDPYGVESGSNEIDAMGLLDTVTTFDKTKTTCQVEAQYTAGFRDWGSGVSGKLKGYEIHMGHTTGDIGLFELKRFDNSELISDGSVKGNVWGTYMHGIFDNDDFRTALLNSIRKKKGLPVQETGFNYHIKKEQAIDRWAGILKKSVDVRFMLRQVGMEDRMAKDK